MVIQNSRKIRESSRVSRPRSSANKLKPNLFCDCFNIKRITLHLFHKTGFKIYNQSCQYAKKILTPDGVINKLACVAGV